VTKGSLKPVARPERVQPQLGASPPSLLNRIWVRSGRQAFFLPGAFSKACAHTHKVDHKTPPPDRDPAVRAPAATSRSPAQFFLRRRAWTFSLDGRLRRPDGSDGARGRGYNPVPWAQDEEATAGLGAAPGAGSGAEITAPTALVSVRVPAARAAATLPEAATFNRAISERTRKA